MLLRRTSILWALAVAVVLPSIPIEDLGASVVSVDDGTSVLTAGDKKTPPKPRTPPRVRPPQPPRPRGGNGRNGRRGQPGGNDYRRGRGNSRKNDRKKKEEKRWYVVQTGRDFAVAEKKELKSLRKKAADRHAKSVKSYKKAKKNAKKSGREFEGSKPAPVVFKLLTSRGFSTEKKAKEYRDRVAKKAKELLRKKGIDSDDKKERGKKSSKRKGSGDDKKSKDSRKKERGKKKDGAKKKKDRDKS
jgi:hypothetical protein